ncbi:hypothetical protein GN958_ATG11486 [Phytophthora infestans]|uniref:Uncharacterized protein n=1 Tax=Phytophthora infestans TaxID=4787 RepID=A0A8S9UF32_PHYIN|nr:hypothetical protein GN958_ATG11486 [Phytophthora infestans]
MTTLTEALLAMLEVLCVGDITWLLRMRIRIGAEAKTTTIDLFQFVTERLQRFAMESGNPYVISKTIGLLLSFGWREERIGRPYSLQRCRLRSAVMD